MHNIVQLPDGATALRNEATGRDALKLRADDSYSFAGSPVVRMFDDFLGDTLNGDFYVIPTKGSDGSTVDFAVSASAVSGAIAGVTGAGGTTTMAVNGIRISGNLNFKANSGGLVAEARVKMSAITNVSLFFGLSDDSATLEAAFESAASADTITANANDAVGFMFDTDMATDNIWLVGVKATTQATAQDSGLAFAADTYKTLRVEVDASGNAAFFIDGAKVGSKMANAVTATVGLCVTLSAFSQAGASRTITADYFMVQSERA